MKYERKNWNGLPFTIYALVCPRTLQVRYVGQTSTPLSQRTHNHTPYHFQGAMRDWLQSLLPEHPIAIVLETGINRRVQFKSSTKLQNKGRGAASGACACGGPRCVRQCGRNV